MFYFRGAQKLSKYVVPLAASEFKIPIIGTEAGKGLRWVSKRNWEFDNR